MEDFDLYEIPGVYLKNPYEVVLDTVQGGKDIPRYIFNMSEVWWGTRRHAPRVLVMFKTATILGKSLREHDWVSSQTW